MAEAGAGVLYLVGTPIGNLEDISYRAVRVLREVELIAAEDTRHTEKLLQHYNIPTRTMSYHEHNEKERASELVERLAAGARIALVSDAGMPGISDPGYRLVTLAVERGIPVVPIPGPAALVAALVASGLPTDAFRYGGFLPAKAGQRRKALEGLRASEWTEVFYEAPHRIVETLEDVVELLGPSRRVVVARELTKIHEEFVRGTAADVLKRFREHPPKGEITLLIGRAEEKPAPRVNASARLAEIMRSEGVDEKAAMKRLAKEMGMGKSELYRELQRTKGRG